VDAENPAGCQSWDAYDVWRILLHHHPVRIDDPSATCGHIARQHVSEFTEAILEYPDYLQDTLWVIAHAKGLGSAMLALDAAIREHLALNAGLLPGEHASPAREKP
jgi:hypothetical protein